MVPRPGRWAITLRLVGADKKTNTQSGNFNALFEFALE